MEGVTQILPPSAERALLYGSKNSTEVKTLLKDGSVIEGIPVVVTNSAGATQYAKAIYEDGDVLYICEAAIGSLLSSAVWRIQLFDSGSVPNQILWCDGNSNFDNTATDLATVKSHSYL